jgi:hypothetical protein
MAHAECRDLSSQGGLVLQSGSAQRGSVWLTSTATVISAAEVSPTAQPAQIQPVQLKTLGWALRRAVLGLAILLTAAGLSAWLLHASIEPDASTGAGARSEYALPPG